MRITRSIRSNLLFLLAEARTEIKIVRTLLEGESSDGLRILNRTGFTQNLNMQIQDSCSRAIAQDGEIVTLRAAATIASNLLRITELCCSCLKTWQSIPSEQRSVLTSYTELLRQVGKGINTIEQALPNRKTTLAVKLGELADTLIVNAQQLEQQQAERLNRQKKSPTQVGALLIARTIAEMGSALLNISEALLSSSLGQTMDLPRFHALQERLNAVGGINSDFSIRAVAESKSGSSIAAVRYRDSDNNTKLVIFKDGRRDKLKEEQQGILRWQQVAPGIAPEIFTYKKEGDSAAMLIEHLQGVTFEQILLQATPRLRADAMKALKTTLRSVWSSTKKRQQRSARFTRQIQKRLTDIYAVHPQFRNRSSSICGIKVHSFNTLLKQADRIEQELPTPFTVLAHGDFNIDNIIFNPHKKTIHFIDLHRSVQMDYIQDISVFMISNYRLQIFSTPVRRRIGKQIREIYTTARRFADENSDSSFEIRLALGLARSFATSTRFIADRTLAERMFLQAYYLLEQVTQRPDPAEYRTPIKELFHE
ncbi:MAG: aminoglycoside phosphotransferase family protein [Mariprofundales bacterium]|nr:aminoglycoside phosphotransferase family protein [Mariprofundales bacterium]